MTAEADPCVYIYKCRTAHRRFAPFASAFSYDVTYLLVDIDRIAEAARRRVLFSHNRWNVFSFHERAHGPRDGAPLRPWAEDLFAGAGIYLDGGRIWLLTLPRVLGHEFNPLSLFLAYGPDGAPRGVIYEVNNTFGETHAYVAPLSGAAADAHSAEKRFHVSPFFDVHGQYEFALSPPGARFALTVRNIVDGQCVHEATLAGRRGEFSDHALVLSALRAPMTALGVLAAIHWEALLIWIKGARYRPKPTPPRRGVTIAAGAVRRSPQSVL